MFKFMAYQDESLVMTIKVGKILRREGVGLVFYINKGRKRKLIAYFCCLFPMKYCVSGLRRDYLRSLEEIGPTVTSNIPY